MLIAAHIEKIRRLNDLRDRLDPLADFELWFWCVMLGGTNAVNAALHHAGITPEERAFPSQPGVFYTFIDGKYRPVLKNHGDVLHVGRPALDGPMPGDIAAMMEQMEKIETYRDPCVRGTTQPTPAIVRQCGAWYSECLGLFRHRFPEL